LAWRLPCRPIPPGTCPDVRKGVDGRHVPAVHLPSTRRPLVVVLHEAPAVLVEVVGGGR
jgi:hypothetical protein